MVAQPFADQNQLTAQADAIAELTRQRDCLIKETIELKERWRVEQDGWDRMAEALIAQRTAAEYFSKEEVSCCIAGFDVVLLGAHFKC